MELQNIYNESTSISAYGGKVKIEVNAFTSFDLSCTKIEITSDLESQHRLIQQEFPCEVKIVDTSGKLNCERIRQAIALFDEGVEKIAKKAKSFPADILAIDC